MEMRILIFAGLFACALVAASGAKADMPSGSHLTMACKI